MPASLPAVDDGSGGEPAATAWWRHAVICQVGIDAVWITPWYPSPMVDGGYDVADDEGGDGFGCLANVTFEPVRLPGEALLVRSDTPAAPGDLLPPGAAAWYHA